MKLWGLIWVCNAFNTKFCSRAMPFYGKLMFWCLLLVGIIILGGAVYIYAFERYRAISPIFKNLNKQRRLISGMGESMEDFEDLYFKRILEAFKNRAGLPKKRKFKNGSVPTFLLVSDDGDEKSVFWKTALRHIYSNECALPCKITFNRNESQNVDAIVLNVMDLRNNHHANTILPNRDASQPWIMLSFESPMKANQYHHADFSEFNNVFNRSLYYRKDSDVLLINGFIASKKDIKYLPKSWVVPVNYDMSWYLSNLNNRTKVAAMTSISNCKDKSGRLNYIVELQKFIAVHVYGACGKLNCGSSMLASKSYKIHENQCAKMFGTKYMFYLAFENAICVDYGTERIYNLLYYPSVPIVLGGIAYSEILPPHSYINAANYTPFELASYLKFLIENPKEYLKYFKWRKYHVPSTLGGERNLCDICVKLYDPAFYKHNVIKNFSKWFHLDSRCERRWTTKTNKHDLL